MLFLKFIGAPGSITFLVLCSAIGLGLIYVWPRKRRLGRSWLLLVFCTYVVLGVPLIANFIANRLPTPGPPHVETLRSVDTLVVFDGDNRRGRVREAMYVYGLASPRSVWVLGGENTFIADALMDSGIPKDRLAHDMSTANTRDQVVRVEHLASGGRTAVVASRLQMPRIVALARAAGLHIVPVPAPVDDEPPTAGARLFVPAYIALRVSRDALYEYAALAYYSWRGWTAPL